MSKAFLFRIDKTCKYTRGYLIINGELFHTLERPWKNNRRNISCIPSGSYNCTYLVRSASGKYRKVYHVESVAKRSGILIHNGNLVKHSKGCILIGMRAGYLDGKPAVLKSRAAVRKLNKLMKGESFTLQVS